MRSIEITKKLTLSVWNLKNQVIKVKAKGPEGLVHFFPSNKTDNIDLIIFRKQSDTCAESSAACLTQV